MKRLFLLILVGFAVAFYIFVRNDESSILEEAVESEEPSGFEPQESSRDEESSGSLAVDEIVSVPMSIGPTRFKNDGLEVPLDFEDSSVSAEQAYRISEDLNSVFSHLSAKLVQHGDQKKIAFEGKGRNWPDVLDSVRILRSSGGYDSLYITKGVSDAYRQAFEFIEKHGIKQSEVGELLADVASGESSVTDIAVLSVHSASTDKLEEVLKEMSKGRIKQPSALAYGGLPDYAPDAVFAETLFLDHNNNIVTYAEVVGVVRVDGEWKIAL